MPQVENDLDIHIQNDKIRGVIESSIFDMFPIIGKTKTLRLDTLHLDLSKTDEMDIPGQKDAKLTGKPWAAPLYGAFSLIDNKTGDVVDKVGKIKIGNVPQLTNRFSVILKKGVEYQTINQLRLKPGVYTRMQANGEFESRFNLEKGFNFRIYMDPAKGIFLINLGNQNYKLYLVLKALGISDKEMLKNWGNEIFQSNASAGTQNLETTIINIYEKLTHKKVTYSEAVAGLEEYLNQTKVSAETTEITLGKPFEKVSAETLLETSKKLLRVMRGEEPPDERDSLLFKKLFPLDELMKSYMEAHEPRIASNLKFRIESKDKINEIVSSETYTNPLFEFFHKSELTSSPPQTNPLEMLSEWRKTTLMGTGGIQSSHAITLETRDIHPTQLGFLDIINTPEGSKIGVTLPLTIGTTRSKGEMHTTVLSATGKEKTLTPVEFFRTRVGFPDQFTRENGKLVGKTAQVKGMYQGEIKEFPRDKIDAWIPTPAYMFSWTTNLIPFLEHNDGARAMMGSKMVIQALPLKNPDSPLVQTTTGGKYTFDQAIGGYLNPHATEAGTITKITDDYIYIRPKADSTRTRKIGLFNSFPLNQGSFLQSIPTVKVGDEVKENQDLAFNNYQKGDTLAMGTNVNVAYMPWHGYNFEDSAVITESLANRFTSETISREEIGYTKEGILDKKKFQAIYPEVLSRSMAENLDDSGIIKIGSTVQPNDVLVAYLEPRDLTDEERILQRMHKDMSLPYANRSLVWHGTVPGKVLYMNDIGREIVIYLKTETPMVVGDKIAGRHGNKMIISKIIPDDEAPHGIDGTRYDLMINPHGVPGRMNVGQLLETAYGKLAKKTGEVVKIKNFSGKDYQTELKDLYKKNNLEFNEVLLDGKDGKPFEHPIFTGNQHMMKLKFVVEHKLKARDYGSYTVDQQPGKGEHGGQKVDPLQTYAMIAHGAKENLYEATAIKGQKNDEIWRALQLGQPLPPPKVNFVFDKLLTYLKAGGIDTEKKGHILRLVPFLDKDTLDLSAGQLTDAGHMVKGKNFALIKGGLFDDDITGGLNGKKWSHITLEEKFPHPIYETAITTMLGWTRPKFDAILSGKEVDENGLTGTDKIEHDLNLINLDKEIEKTKEDLKDAPEGKVNTLNRKIRYMQALEKNGLKPSDYLIKYLPVMPPIFRPIYTLPGGTVVNSPINNHYRAVAELNHSLKTYKDLGPEVYKEFAPHIKSETYRSLKELYGLIDVAGPREAKYEGIIKTLAGRTPKEGLIQEKAWSKRQDLSSRSTITLEPSLGLDNIGIPYDMAKIMFRPFIVQELVTQGYSPIKALEEIKKESAVAKQALVQAMTKRPVILNRAPTLHKHGVQAFHAQLFPGKSIRLNPLIVKGFNADFDGDTMSAYIPIRPQAVEEAWNMVPSKNIFKGGEREHNVPMSAFSQDYMLGLWHMTRDQKNTNLSFDTTQEAKAAGLGMGDSFTLKGIGKTTLGRLAVNKTLPVKYRDYQRTFDRKNLEKLMTTIAKKDPHDFATVIDSLKDLGNQYGHKYGMTISVTDTDVDHSFRDKLLKDAWKKVNPKWSDDDKAKFWLGISNEVWNEGNVQLKKSDNSFVHMLNSGSMSKAGSVSQIISMLGVKADIKGKAIPRPFTGSWAEGLDTADYWENMYSARKGIVDRAIKTEESGALNKALLGAIRDLLVTEHDCETLKGIDSKVDDMSTLDRCAAETIAGVVRRNSVITSEVIEKAKAHNITSLLVRSPLTCATEDGICQLCYGLMPGEMFPPIGTNVGVLDGQAVTERSTQLTMQTFHTGGSVTTGGGITQKFPRLEQLLQVPKTVKSKAILATQTGTVQSITKSPLGGFDITINGVIHHVPIDREITVKTNEYVTKGDTLTTGNIKPQELAELKDFHTAQRQIVNDMDDIFDKKFHKRTFETVVRGVSNNAEIINAPDGSGYLRGDVEKLSKIEAVNEERNRKGQPLIEYTPYFRSISMLPSDSQDWLSRLTTSRLKQTITESAATGMATNIHGTNPLPAYLYGLEFGKHLNPEKKEFY